MLYRRTNLGERVFQGCFHLADARKEQVATNSPNQQTRKGTDLRVAPNAAIGLGTWKLAEHRSLWVAGYIDQLKQGEYDSKGVPIHKAQPQAATNANKAINNHPPPRNE